MVSKLLSRSGKARTADRFVKKDLQEWRSAPNSLKNATLLSGMASLSALGAWLDGEADAEPCKAQLLQLMDERAQLQTAPMPIIEAICLCAADAGYITI